MRRRVTKDKISAIPRLEASEGGSKCIDGNGGSKKRKGPLSNYKQVKKKSRGESERVKKETRTFRRGEAWKGTKSRKKKSFQSKPNFKLS